MNYHSCGFLPTVTDSQNLWKENWVLLKEVEIYGNEMSCRLQHTHLTFKVLGWLFEYFTVVPVLHIFIVFPHNMCQKNQQGKKKSELFLPGSQK